MIYHDYIYYTYMYYITEFNWEIITDDSLDLLRSLLRDSSVCFENFLKMSVY